jgi:L-serine dehydratase
MISAFDLFKIGIGPSSSHTVGPMVAARRFKKALDSRVAQVRVELFGSLAWTGRGHGSDSAICLGLLDQDPSTVDPDKIAGEVAAINAAKSFRIECGHLIAFDPVTDLIFDFVALLPGHSNGMRFRALSTDGSLVLEKVYYSIGGGFVLEEGAPAPYQKSVPYPFASSVELLHMCAKAGLSISDLQLANEIALSPLCDVEQGLDRIHATMFACIDRGLHLHGVLPGKLKVKRRANTILKQLEARELSNRKSPHEIMDWISVYAIAVNEENAAGGRVVTAPTNGAAGIVPAVLRYFRDFCAGYSDEQARVYLLSATAIGSLIKRNASISGAEVGCQGEVGSAAAMAAAGLAAVLGASPEQIENAAEIAMEHHLGMTCDPIGGLVQIPCIERNAFGANKAVAAASLALKGDGKHHVSLDAVVETMRQTGADMQSKYKETSLGGLAVNVPEC